MARGARYRLIDLSTGESACFAASGRVERIEDDDRAPLVALVPADRCSVVRVDVPEMSSARLSRALRWAAEDAIAGDPEQQHVVPIRRDVDGRLLCLVAARADMDQWIERAGGRPIRMLPDAACVPAADDELVLLPHADRILVRSGADVFDRLEPELVDSIVPELLDATDEAGRTVWLGSAPPPDLGVEPIQEIGSRPLQRPVLDAMAGEALSERLAAFNLMRGDYAPAETTVSSRQWRTAGFLGSAVLVLALGSVVTEYWLVERERRQLSERVEARFTEIFPSITTVVRPRAQAERALAALRGSDRDRFVELLGAVSPLFLGAEGVDVDSLRYAEGGLEIELATPGLPDLEALQRQLRARGLDSDLANLEVRTDRARGRLTVRRETP